MSSMGSGKLPGIGGTVLFAMLLSTAGSTRIEAQDATRSALSATMLRALAEAADQYRTGRRVFLVADHRFPHNVIGPFASATEARRVQADSGRNFGVFGPYVTRPDPGSDSTFRVLAVSITVETPEGEDTIAVDPTKVDALFFTVTAVDKFVVPYYTRIYGADYASILRDKVMRKWPRPVCHIGSHSCWPAPLLGSELIPIWDPVRGPLRVGPAPADVPR